MTYCSMPGCPKTTGPCPLCQPPQWQLPTQPVYTTGPQGCVCPPTSEQTCQSPICPRKNHSGARIAPNTSVATTNGDL